MLGGSSEFLSPTYTAKPQHCINHNILKANQIPKGNPVAAIPSEPFAN
jgi:hypothetical protein